MIIKYILVYYIMIKFLTNLNIAIENINPFGNNNIIFLDIDNTLLEPQNIYIYYERNGINQTFTPEEYAKLDVRVEDKKYYDYSDFRNPKIVKKSIKTARPIRKTLSVVNRFVNSNFQLGILTARGQENLIAKILPKWLNQNLKTKFKRIKRENIHAINDLGKKYKGTTDPERKLNVLKEHIKSGKYDNIFFIDDNKYTIDLINKYNKRTRKNKRIHTILVDW